MELGKKKKHRVPQRCEFSDITLMWLKRIVDEKGARATKTKKKLLPKIQTRAHVVELVGINILVNAANLVTREHEIKMNFA